MKHPVTFSLLLSTVALTSILAAQAQPAGRVAPNAQRPRIEFSETIFNFGKVQPSDTLRHDFIVTNTGTALLEISDVRPACGCTMAGTWDRTIEPGKTGRIPIQFSPANFNGEVAKSIAVACNDPEKPALTLEIRATIWRAVDVQPAQVYFAPVEGEQTEDLRVVRIINNLEQPLTLESPQCSNPDFNLELKTLQPGKEFALHVKYSGIGQPGTPPSPITIKTSSTELPVISIAANAIPQPAVAVMPPQIMIPAGQLTLGHRHSQIIRNNGRAPLKLSEAAVNAAGVSVEIEEAEPGRFFRLNIVFPPNFQLLPGQPLKLTVHTSDEKRPVITVPIRHVPAPSVIITSPPVQVTGAR